jgi:hypothetical protein
MSKRRTAAARDGVKAKTMAETIFMVSSCKIAILRYRVLKN